MADIDRLSINITSSSSAAILHINKIITELNKLDNAFKVSSEAKQFKANLSDLTAGFYDLGEAVGHLDISKIQSLNNSIGTLARNISTLQGVKSTLADIGRVSVYSGKTKAELQEEIAKFTEMRDSAKKAKDTLQSFGAVGATKDLRSYLGDDFNRINGFLQNIPGKLGHISPDAYDKYWEVTGKMLPMNETQAIADYGYEIAKQNDIFEESKRKVAELEAQLKLVPEGYERIKEEMVNLNTTARGADGDLIANYAGGLPWEEGTTQAIEEVKTKAEEVKAVGNPFANIIVGLQSLETVNIPAEQFAGLSIFASSVNKLAGADMASVAANLPTIAQGLHSFDNYAPTNVEGIVSMANALAQFGYKRVVNASTSLPAIATAITEISNVHIENVAQIESLATALNGFGRAGIRHATEVLPTLTAQLQQLVVTLSNSPQISDNLVRLTEALATFSTRANGVNSALPRSTSHLNLFGRSALANRIHIRSLASTIGMLYAKLFLVIRAFRLLGKAINLSSEFTEAQNVVQVAFGKMSDKLYDFTATSIKDFGLSRLAASQYASRFQAMGKTMGISADAVVKANERIYESAKGNPRAYEDLGNSVSDMSINLTKLTADLASLYNQDYEDVASDMQSIYTGMTRPMRKFGIDLSSAAMKEYALKNGIEGNVTAMTQAEKTMLRYQMVMSQASGAMGDFQKTANTWANSMRTVKQLLSEIARTIGEGFINALLPALNAFKQFLFNFLELTQSALNAIGKLLGWKQINFGGASLVEDTEDYAEALDDAAGAAKKLKGQLRGIDELNNLTTSNPSGGGGGADGLLGANGGNLLDNIVDTEEAYESTVKNWEDFGKRIADAITNGLTSIDWESRKEQAKKFGENFAKFLNGLFDEEMFKSVGTTIAEALNTAVNLAFGFGKEFDGGKFGRGIANGINAFFRNFDFNKLGITLLTWAEKLGDAIASAIKNIDWGSVYEGIGDFLDAFGLKEKALPYSIPIMIEEWQKALDEWDADNLGELFVKIIDKVTDQMLDGIYKAFGKAKSEVTKAMVSAFPTVDELLQKVRSISNTVTGSHTKAGELVDANTTDSLVQAFFELGYDIAGGVWEGIKAGAVSLAKSAAKVTYDAIKKAIEVVFGISSPAKKMYDVGENIVLGIIEGFKLVPFLEKLNTWFEENVKPWFSAEKWQRLGQTVKDKLSNTLSYNALYNIGASMGKGLYNAFTSYLSDLYNAFLKVKAQIESTSITQTVNVIGSVTSVGNNAIELVENLTSNPTPHGKGGEEVAPKNTKTEIAYPKNKPFGMSDSEWKAYLASWEKNHPTSQYIYKYARGGFPELGGSLFLAGEAGAELVGNINGRTGVASNAEITGISDTIRMTSAEEIALLRQQNNLLQGILEKEFGISKDTLFRSVQSSATDFRTRTGRPAF